jgi:hypothetical protein
MALFLSFSLQAADIAILPVNVTNLSSSQGDAIGAVMAQQYGAISKKQVIGPAKTRDALAADSGNIPAAVKRLGVSEYVVMNAVALQTKILLEALLYNQAGSENFRAQMTAISLDDITEVSDRLARALIFRQPTTETINIDNVTEKETQEPNRVFSEKISGVKCGMIYVPSSSILFEPMIYFGYNMRLEAKKYFLEFGATPLIPTNSHTGTNEEYYGGVYLELGGSYYLNTNFMSPYIGAGISPRVLFYGAVTIGAAPYIQAGFMLMRFSSTRIYCDVRVAQNALPLNFETTQETYDPAMGYYTTTMTSKRFWPTEASFQIGIGW